MKKRLVILSFLLVLILSLSLVSAGWFGNFFGKITGHASANIDSEGWTDWLNRDTPRGLGDWENLASFRTTYIDLCPVPLDIQCQTTAGADYKTTGEVITCTTSYGLACEASKQPDGVCNYDYKVRFKCPITCLNNSDCPVGYMCSNEGKCILECTDSDSYLGGLQEQAYLRGNVTTPKMSINDSCYPNYIDLVQEHFCEPSSYTGVSNDAIYCAQGDICKDGACVSKCGNGVVDAGENCSSCPADAGCSVGKVCRNNVCVNATCTDSDGGENLTIRGEVVVVGERYSDYCGYFSNPDSASSFTESATGKLIREYYCVDTPAIYQSTITACPSGTTCMGGACRDTCKDSDGGKNYTSPGTTSRGVISVKDRCVSSINLIEYYCSSEIQGGVILAELYTCPSGYMCSSEKGAGKCTFSITLWSRFKSLFR